MLWGPYGSVGPPGAPGREGGGGTIEALKGTPDCVTREGQGAPPASLCDVRKAPIMSLEPRGRGKSCCCVQQGPRRSAAGERPRPRARREAPLCLNKGPRGRPRVSIWHREWGLHDLQKARRAPADAGCWCCNRAVIRSVSASAREGSSGSTGPQPNPWKKAME